MQPLACFTLPLIKFLKRHTEKDLNVPSGTVGSFLLHSSCRASFTGTTLYIQLFFFLRVAAAVLRCQFRYLRNVQGLPTKHKPRGKQKKHRDLQGSPGQQGLIGKEARSAAQANPCYLGETKRLL